MERKAQKPEQQATPAADENQATSTAETTEGASAPSVIELIRAELDELGVKYHPNTGEVKLQALLDGHKEEAQEKGSVNAPVAPEVMVSKAKTQVLIANQHSGGITLPRLSRGGLYTKPIRFAPGSVSAMDADEWAKYKKMKMVRVYLDKRLLSEVDRKGDGVPILSASSSDLVIPENLRTAEDDTKNVRVDREKTAEITID